MLRQYHRLSGSELEQFWEIVKDQKPTMLQVSKTQQQRLNYNKLQLILVTCIQKVLTSTTIHLNTLPKEWCQNTAVPACSIQASERAYNSSFFYTSPSTVQLAHHCLLILLQMIDCLGSEHGFTVRDQTKFSSVHCHLKAPVHFTAPATSVQSQLGSLRIKTLLIKSMP